MTIFWIITIALIAWWFRNLHKVLEDWKDGKYINHKK